MFRKSFLIALGVLLVQTVAARASLAAQNEPEASVQSETVPEGVPLYSPYAEAIAYVGDGKIQNSKGFSSFSRPSTGVYCLGPSASVSPNTVPVVSVEWHLSFGVANFAQWDNDNSNCPAGSYEVLTYKGETGGVGTPLQVPVLSNEVAFVILIP
jgi:hypothetical protein